MKQTATQYLNQAVKTAGEELKIKNLHAYPKITKAVIHMGIGKDRGNSSLVDNLAKDLAKITGQKPSYRQARKAIASFKVRQGEVIGIMVTLRGKKMADFVSKLIHVALPSIRDFRGIPQTSFDKQGNYNLGIKEHTVFPEISFTRETNAHGLQITLSTTAKTTEEAKVLFKQLGFPWS